MSTLNKVIYTSYVTKIPASNLNEIQDCIVDLQADDESAQEDISILEAKVEALEDDVSAIQEDITDIKSDIDDINSIQIMYVGTDGKCYARMED